jgi:DNA-binding NarL/FixJ family response regulator
MKQSIRIIVAEKGELMCAGISTILKDQPDMVLLGEAKTKEEIVSKCQDKPDVLLLAQNLPCPSLPSLIEELVEGYPSVKILILTPCQDMKFVRATLKAGAQGYVLSDKSIADVLSAIRAVAGGEKWLSPSLGAKLFMKELPDTSSLSTTLTDQRLAILRLIGAGKNNKEIALIMQIGRRTVSYHISEIFRALSG